MNSRQGSWPVPGRPRSSVVTAANSDDADDAQKALNFWVSEARKLPEDQRAFFFDGNQAGSYSDYVEVLKDAVQQKADRSLVMRFSKKMLPVYHLANSIAPIASSASQLNPMPASLVLGGVICILSISVSFDQYQSKIIETLEYMVDAVDNVNLYRDKKMFDSDAGVKTCETRLATDILEFCVTVAKMFYNKQGKSKNSIRTALKMQGNPFEADLSQIKTKFEAHLQALEAQRQVVSGYREKDKAAEAEALRRNKEEIKERQRQQRRFLEWLPAIDFSGSQEDHFERRVEGSGSWLIEHEAFRSWRDSSPSTLLWVYGKPGSGKSHLAAKAIDDLSHESSRMSGSALAYVYCSSISSNKGTHFGGMLASILAQLCRQLPLSDDFGHLIPRKDYGEGSGPTRREMRNGIAQALSKFQTSHIVIDGLDECHDWENDHFREFCAFILELTSPLSRSTKVLILSRPSYAEIERIVAGFPRIQVDNGANLPDLEHYISQKVEEVLRDPSEDERSEFRGIRDQLLKNSAGTFLWPDRKLSHLKEMGSIGDMSNAMENSTGGLEDLYRQDIERILAKPSRFIRERAMNALLWITNSRRPLSKAELFEALSVKRGQTGLNVRQRLSSGTPLCTECADLIVEKDGAFHLYHPSLKDFLVAEYQTIPGYNVLQRNADERLAEICLTYLNFDVFSSTNFNSERELESVMKSFPLLCYVSANWGHHFSIASENPDDGIVIRRLLRSFLQTEAAMSLSLQVLFPTQWAFPPLLGRPPGTPTALHIFAAHNLVGLAKSLKDWEHLIDCQDRALRRPIDYATTMGNKEMAMLIDAIPGLDIYSPASHGPTALHGAACSGAADLVQWLLEKKPSAAFLGDQFLALPIHHASYAGELACVKLLSAPETINAQDSVGKTPLMVACEGGYLPIVQFLVQSDANTDIASRETGETAVFIALKQWHKKVAGYLIESGADCTTPNVDGQTPLHHAAHMGDIGLVEQLLKHGSDPSIGDCNGYTPLMDAVSYGRLEVVHLLLAKDPTASSVRSIDGTTCLHLAAGGASTQVLKLILDASPELVLEVDDAGFDAMCWAARSGRWEAIMVLADRGLSINGASGCLDSPLETAIACGFTDLAAELIKRGADLVIDRVADVNYDQRTSLIIAAMDGRKQAAEFLLENGADPYLRDAHRFCAADYFLMNGWTQDSPRFQLPDYEPLDRSTQLEMLRHTIVDTSEQIIAKKGSSSSGAKGDSTRLLAILAYALLLFQSKTSLSHLQQALEDTLQDETCALVCTFCQKDIKSQSLFVCPKYGTGRSLCASCHESYLLSANEAGSLPVHILLLQELELSALRVLKVMEIFRNDDGRNISACLRCVTLAETWIYAILRAYGQLASDGTMSEERSFETLPGYTPPVHTYGFVSLLGDFQEFQSSPTDESTLLEQQGRNTTMESIVHGLNNVYNGFRPNYNPAPFFYHGHRYIRIENARSEAETPKYLDGDKEPRPRFYEDVIAYYSNVDIDEIDDLITHDPLPVCSNRREADDDRIRKALRTLDEEAVPRLMEKTIRQDWVDRSFEQLWEKLKPLYEKRETLGEDTADLQTVDEEIELYEVAWKMVHAMLDIPFERTVWEEKHDRQDKWREALSITLSEEVASDDGSDDSWHTADEGALEEEDGDDA
ncbi:Ankyrin repeat, PH and SEC7 domain containing protein secG [Colletotrichum orbiculare MAFF 240422]|uniref:Ankyrin repeat, PH and SEC7 domain containing protein secG n=1 Tax=Colletotrichum orbiculare (strain 104-T / ATCC 96160 / CBS 514.97 / LARS 414 / MAFF 240422) TaxID=1213857 RepID=A0A484FN29_COLOR|nr:Ankyrin repeat, PH and SEC7 domain containing protein secG [Colletotrichum orbiculare MAFF 240422]